MNRITSNIANSTQNLDESIFNFFNEIRGTVSDDQYSVILFLFIADNYGIIEDCTIQIDISIPEKIIDSILKSELPEARYLIDSFSIYQPMLYNIDDYSLLRILNSIKSLRHKFIYENAAALFELIFQKIIGFQGKLANGIFIPVEVTKFIGELAGVNENSSIYNPFCGAASFAVYFEKYKSYIGQEINRNMHAIGLLRILAYGYHSKARLFLGDSISDWIDSPSGKFDLIIANPPLNHKFQNLATGPSGKINSIEQFMIEVGLDSINPNGSIILIVSNQFLFGSGSIEVFRKTLVNNGQIETIISFPKGLLDSTSIAFSVIVIKKPLKDRKVVFVNATGYFKQISKREKRFIGLSAREVLEANSGNSNIRIATKSDIVAEDYNINVIRYFKSHEEGVPLGELISQIGLGKVTEFSNGEIIRIADLKEDNLHYTYKAGGRPEEKLSKDFRELGQTALLLSTRWNSLKPTFFEYEGNSIYFRSEIVAFKINTNKVEVNYLIGELLTDFVNKQLEPLRKGVTITSISIKDLMSIKIKLPSIEDQRIIAKDRAISFLEFRNKEILEINKLHGIDTDISDQNTFLRHSLAGPAKSSFDAIKNIREILNEKVAPLIPDLYRFKVSDRHSIDLAKYIEILERDTKRMLFTVSNQLKAEIEIESVNLEPLDILSFLNEYFTNLREREIGNYNVKMEDFTSNFRSEETGKDLKVNSYFNRDLMITMLDNLVENAVKHAFSGGSDNFFNVSVFKSEIPIKDKEGVFLTDRDAIVISITNSGKPFPENFELEDYIRKGSKSGPNAGDGFGGWYVNEIAKKFNGDIEITDETRAGDGFPHIGSSTIDIRIPIYEINENENV